MPSQAIVGANAFQHESGIHQDGMLKSKSTYEIMSPETIGMQRTDDAGIVLGKHSGRNALGTRLRQLGFDLAEDQITDVMKRFKALADKKKVRGRGGFYWKPLRLMHADLHPLMLPLCLG